MEERLRNVLQKVLGEDYAVIEKTENFRDSDFWDSVRYVNLVVALQNEFNIQLKKDEIRNLFSIASIKGILAGYGIQA